MGCVVEHRDPREEVAAALASEFTVTTDEEGRFEFAGLEAGQHHIEVGAAGFQKWKRDDVQVGATLEVVLEREEPDAENDP